MPRARVRGLWVLSVLACVLFSAWLVGGYGRLMYEWEHGRVALGQRGLSLSVYAEALKKPRGLDSFWRWKGPQWYQAMWWQRKSGLFAAGCSLLAPAMVVGVFAAGRWYRRVLPFDRPGRPNRSRQLRWTRWTLTIVFVAMVGISIASYWFSFRWTLPSVGVKVEDGHLWWGGGGSSSASFLGNVSVDPITSRYDGSIFVVYEWLRLGSSVTLEMSVWLADAVVLSLAGFLWFLRSRRYPFDGACSNPRCRYDRRGIPEHLPCPECGRVPAQVCTGSVM